MVFGHGISLPSEGKKSFIELISPLVNATDPSLRFLARKDLLGEDPSSLALSKLREEIRNSEVSKKFLDNRTETGVLPYHAYRKWIGSHWLLVTLAELGYPPKDMSLVPIREQVFEWLHSPSKIKQTARKVQGKVRNCASQEANAVFSQISLGLADERTDDLVSLLLDTRWPDGGWNCDKKATVSVSSFHETITPLRALVAYHKAKGGSELTQVIASVAEVFLERHLCRKKSTGDIIDHRFLQLHYPHYYFYDILFALHTLAAAGLAGDSRTAEALDILLGKQLADGGFPCESRLYQSLSFEKPRYSPFNWGGAKKTALNPFVTIEALSVLRITGRI